MFLTTQKDFSIREFLPSDFQSLFCIADKINKQAHEKEGFQPFYAFQGDIYSPTYTKELTEKTNKFLSRALKEKEVSPRSTHRLALCSTQGQLIGNVTIDVLPFQDETGKQIHGDIGYFINPDHGRQGLMSKAIEHVLNIYFQTHSQMDVTVHPNNLYSLKMMQRFNAKIIGFKEDSCYQGEPRVVLKLTKQDYLNRPQPVLICQNKIISNKNQNQRMYHV